MELNKEEVLKMYDEEATIAAVARKYCKKYNMEYSDSMRKKFSYRIHKWSEDIDNYTSTETNQYSNDSEVENNLFMPSAWDLDKNRFLSIDEYCDKYGLPKDQVRSSKLVAHQQKHMIYNIAFNETLSDKTGIELEDIKNIVLNNTDISKNKYEPKSYDKDIYTNLTITDVHVGMEPNKYNNSLYGGKWNEEELLRRKEETVKFTLDKSISSKSNKLIIRDLGDLADGLDGQTVRGGHDLPQNMSNVEMYDTAVKFRVSMVDDFILSGQYETIDVHNICNSNHGGDFDYFINYTVKHILETKYPNVKVTNYRKFISHYSIGDHCFIISHGKDDKTLKFGFKPKLDLKGLEKIDQYIKGNDLYTKYKYFHFCKGDSHQFLFDFSSSQDFDYLNYPAFSPSSQWVQNNFKKGISGFVVETFSPTDESLDIYYKKFNWK